MIVAWALLSGSATAVRPAKARARCRLAAAGQTDDPPRTGHIPDVAGADEEKEELKEIVDFLKNPKKYSEIGRKFHVAFFGRRSRYRKTPAGQSSGWRRPAAFFSISGSDFVEMLLASAPRGSGLVDTAKKNTPSSFSLMNRCGRPSPRAGLGGGHDERNRPLTSCWSKWTALVRTKV